MPTSSLNKKDCVFAASWLNRFSVSALLACALGMAGIDAHATFPAVPNTRVFYWGAEHAPRFLDANAAATAMLALQQSSSYYICSNYVGQPGSPDSCSFDVTSLSSIATGEQYFTYYQYARSNNSYGGAGSFPIYTGLENYCPVTSDLSGTTCTCKAGYLQNAENDDCYHSERVDLLRASKPPKSCPASSPGFGNPVYPLTGSKKEVLETGLVVGGHALRLTYDSARQITAAAAAVAAKDYGDAPSFGGLWLSSLHRRLLVSPAGFGIRLFRGDGTVVSFRYQDGSYVADADSSDRLTRVGSTYRYIDVVGKSIETYASTGQLMSLVDVAGNTLSFDYSSSASSVAPAAGYLVRVTDQTGRSLRFEYALPSGGVAATDGRISAVINTAGQPITTAYDGNGNLTSLTWEDGKVRQFLYENPLLAWALTGVVDENNSRQSIFGYDSAGRAVSTEHAGGINRYSVSYGTPPTVVIREVYDAASLITYRYHEWQAPSGVLLTTPNAQSVDLGATAVLGASVMTGISQPAGSGCSASMSASSYDASGNVVSVDDFTGHRSCYAYDNKNRETTRVDGLANTASCAAVLPGGALLPPGSRKTETTWHLDWRLPTKVIQPLLSTSLIYQGQPDPFDNNMVSSCTAAGTLPDGTALPLVCKQVEQATLGNGLPDPATPVRTTRFTYDAAGRVLTHVDQNNKTTAYAYYVDITFGDDGDANFGNVSLLLHGDGLNGSSTFTDSSAASKTMAVSGAAQVRTAQSRSGGGSMYFNGSGSYLSTAADASLDVGLGDFTVETWYYVGSATDDQAILTINKPAVSTGVDVSMGIQHFGELLLGKVRAFIYSGANQYSVDSSGALTANTWYHIAFVRSSGVLSLYLNGVLQSSVNGNFAPNTPTTGGSLFVGRYSNSDPRYLNGYLDDLRFSKGVARYTANFTPSTGAFPNNGAVVIDPNATGHSTGDLQSITNAAGHVTQFPLYDRAGRVRQMVDPKGVVTDIAYTPRGWTSSVTVTPPSATARTTTYTYDNAGQMTGATLPDGTTLGYSYDAAHRLISVTDAKGNTVTYTLDNAGNRTGEQVKDPSGNLQRNITRVYDALNRIQQVTGASN